MIGKNLLPRYVSRGQLFSLLMLILVLVASTLAALIRIGQQREAVLRHVAIQNKENISRSLEQNIRSPATMDIDFARRLPRTVDLRPFLVELERSTTNAGVEFGGVQLQPQNPTPQQLARVDATVSLRGAYPKLKQVMAETLDRFPNVTLAQWRVRRLTQPSDLEATMVLAVWGAAAEVPVGQADTSATASGIR